MNILVLCTGNSARSIILEKLLDRLGGDGVTTYSAGSTPAGKVHPQTLIMLGDKGYDLSDARSKSWDEFAEPGAPGMDVVITVCGSAASETCPIWPGAPVRGHWGVEDPAAAAEPDWDAAFATAYDELEKRAEAFVAADIHTMSRADLQAHVSSIEATA
ncbi:arsenate reductase ArsC [Cognatishimia sp. MH4019]|uniref:arsenate reductase ArsC n=1 Tax=Cognatishimia sp. MH4019 TaxID=2854030 RepID=UPI001CD2D630|nr:arsenate reductase ArsC [Cognatishimia sp. MH4019]